MFHVHASPPWCASLPRPALHQPALTQRQAAQIVTVERHDVEDVELDFSVGVPLCSALKSATPSTPSTTPSPSITNCRCRFFSAASTIHGYRSVQL
jgi:hypothetical protein